MYQHATTGILDGNVKHIRRKFHTHSRNSADVEICQKIFLNERAHSAQPRGPRVQVSMTSSPAPSRSRRRRPRTRKVVRVLLARTTSILLFVVYDRVHVMPLYARTRRLRCDCASMLYCMTMSVDLMYMTIIIIHVI